MKNLIVFILMLFLMVQTAYAETKIFSGNVITDTDKEIGGSNFKFKYDDKTNKVFVQTPTKALIVDNGACKSNDVFRVCINRANFSHKDIATYVYYYEIDATIYKLTGSLSSSSKSALSTLLQGESTQLTLTITNPTEFDIANIALSYGLSPFYPAEVKGCELNDRQMSWKGSLQPKYDKTCTATIIAEKEGKYNLAGNLSYFNGFETEKKTTDILPITVLPKQLKISQLIDKSIELKRPFYFNISMQNIHASEDINVFATITIPSHVSLIKDKPAFEKNARVLRDGAMLKAGAWRNYSLYMEKLLEGTEPINLKFTYTIKGISDLIENNTYVDIISNQQAYKPSEPKSAENTSQITSNLTAAKDSQSSQAVSENKTTEARIEPGNKTEENIIELNAEVPKSSNKRILLIVTAALASFIIVAIVIFRIRKRGKGSEELTERIRERLDEEIK